MRIEPLYDRDALICDVIFLSSSNPFTQLGELF